MTDAALNHSAPNHSARLHAARTGPLARTRAHAPTPIPAIDPRGAA